jgi:hypothetical protein
MMPMTPIGTRTLRNLQAVGANPFLQHLAHRIGQGSDLAHGLGELFQARLVEDQPIDLRRGQSVGPCTRRVRPVGRQNRPGRGVDQVREPPQRVVLRRRRRDRQRERRRARAAAEVGDDAGKVFGHERTNKHGTPSASSPLKTG